MAEATAPIKTDVDIHVTKRLWRSQIPAIKKASDYQEVMSKFETVFGDRTSEVKAWGDEFANQVGRSKTQTAQFLAGAQDLFIPLGFEPGAAEQMSKTVTGLAVDLASFNNMADEDVMRDLQAAMTGSGETMKKYGVIVSEAAVKQELLNQGLDPKVASDQQKVQKYGRTTGLTFGEIESINTSINVTYGSAGSQVARFTGQIIICCSFSAGGDSGSLIVGKRDVVPPVLTEQNFFCFDYIDAPGGRLIN